MDHAGQLFASKNLGKMDPAGIEHFGLVVFG
jgi:hypothetical protein